jgi:hypothetical protein
MMDQPETPPLDPKPGRFASSGTRRLLAFVAVVALGMGWFADHHRQAERRTILLSELGGSKMFAMLNEPTLTSQCIMKFCPGREKQIRYRIGPGWLDHPSIFLGGKIRDDEVPGIARRLRELGTVREVHYERDPLTPLGIAMLQAELPGVNVVPLDSPELHHYFRSKTTGTHALYGPLWVMLGVLAVVLGLLIFSARWLARQLRHPPKPALASMDSDRP